MEKEKSSNESNDVTTEDQKIKFWGNNPNELFAPTNILELFPVSSMSYNQKLNAVSRMVIILSVIMYFILRTWRVVVIGFMTLGAIWIIQHNNKKKVRFAEGFKNNPAEDYVENHLIPNDLFSEPTNQNPLQNVMLTDYSAPNDKKPAPPSYIPETQDEIIRNTKIMIDQVNPEQPKLSDKLFRSLEDNLVFEQSLRPFNSNPSTTIPNDQGAFAEFCYGSMVSCKEGNPFACARNLARHTN